MVILAFLATIVLNTLGTGLVTVTTTERLATANFRETHELLYAAEAAAECAAAEVMRAASWNDVLAGTTHSAFEDGTFTPRLASGQTIDLRTLTSALQTTSDADMRRGANNPHWRLFLYAPLGAIVRSTRTTVYVAAWVADDIAETDNDPLTDSNGVVTIRAQAMIRDGLQRVVEATIANQNLGIGIVSWREVR